MNTMHPTPDPELDSFDRALIGELRLAVAQRAATPLRRPRRRASLTVGGIAAATVAAFGISAMLPGAAAYAVDRTATGDITITIHHLDDADGLEKALAGYGIEANVDYDASSTNLGPAPSGVSPQALPDGESVGLTSAGSASASASAGIEGSDAPDSSSPCGDFADLPKTAMNGDDYVITIPADSPILNADSVLEITTSGDLADAFAGLQVDYTVNGVKCGFGSVQAGAMSAQ